MSKNHSLSERASGILLHPTSLPGMECIGTLGDEAFHFIDFLVKAKQSYWQILPLGPTGFADSPYQCFSAHAGNPDLISLGALIKEKWLSPTDLNDDVSANTGYVDYASARQSKESLLRKAYAHFVAQADHLTKLKYRNFQKENFHWLEDYALFISLKSHFHQQPWYQWDPEIRQRFPEVLKAYQKMLKDEIGFHKFLQYLFLHQWMAVKDYAHKRSIRIIGDIPLYIALDSADAWVNTGIFEFDEACKPIRVGGVPPDYFSETGQLWGNPLYRWDEKPEEVFHWWANRISTNLTLFDIIRIDHFRGFAAYWAIPNGENNAINGSWVDGPGKTFFDAMMKRFDNLPFIAEDLGVITPDVEELRDTFDFPGMKILEFAFDSNEENDYIPYNYVKNSIVYTGTHDNDTVAGWFKIADEADKKYALAYMNCSEEAISWEMIRLAWASVANTAIVPMQDLLGLGSKARMNIPGTTVDNWKWRAHETDFTQALAEKLARLTLLFGRYGTTPKSSSKR